MLIGWFFIIVSFFLFWKMLNVILWADAETLQKILRAKGYRNISNKNAQKLFINSNGLMKIHLPPYEHFAVVPGVDVENINTVADTLLRCCHELEADKKEAAKLSASSAAKSFSV